MMPRTPSSSLPTQAASGLWGTAPGSIACPICRSLPKRWTWRGEPISLPCPKSHQRRGIEMDTEQLEIQFPEEQLNFPFMEAV